MRQAGYLAAACIFALDNNVERLHDDHRRAKQLENLLLSLPYVEAVMPVQTNLVFFSLKPEMPTKNFLHKLLENNIHAMADNMMAKVEKVLREM